MSATADAVFGARRSFLVNLLRDHKLTAVWPLAERYSNLEPSQPFVSSITIRTLDKPTPQQATRLSQESRPDVLGPSPDDGSAAATP